MLDSLITSKTRIKLLLKFFLNPGTRAYLRGLATEFGESTNSIRVELNRLTDAKLLKSYHSGRTVEYQANKEHSLYNDIQNVVKKFVGMDTLAEELVAKLGNIQSAYVIGDYAQGKDTGLIDLALVGQIDNEKLKEMVEKTEGLIHRKIRTLVLAPKEMNKLITSIDKKPRQRTTLYENVTDETIRKGLKNISLKPIKNELINRKERKNSVIQTQSI